MVYNQIVTWTAFAILAMSGGSESSTAIYLEWIIFSPLKSVEHEPPTEKHRKNPLKRVIEIYYKNLMHCVETFMRSNDFADVPIVCDDGSVTLAHKVILAFL